VVSPAPSDVEDGDNDDVPFSSGAAGIALPDYLSRTRDREVEVQVENASPYFHAKNGNNHQASLSSQPVVHTPADAVDSCATLEHEMDGGSSGGSLHQDPAQVHLRVVMQERDRYQMEAAAIMQERDRYQMEAAAMMQDRDRYQMEAAAMKVEQERLQREVCNLRSKLQEAQGKEEAAQSQLLRASIDYDLKTNALTKEKQELKVQAEDMAAKLSEAKQEAVKQMTIALKYVQNLGERQ
jgi:hypothetical protein